ncbi:hypothetical protein [Lacimonas salitolerans]|uniref:Uncharacterized protein n=1 Tax=Lacimonas salitolerans TaxID=1323750 RepID=A0ABW4EKI9_9RHOB
MGMTEDLADELARDTIKLVEATGDDALITQIATSLAASSTPAQEAFMASIRVRMAVDRARKLLHQKAQAAQKARQEK